MNNSEEFELALKEAEFLKLLKGGAGTLARQFLLLVEENKKLSKQLEDCKFEIHLLNLKEISYKEF